MFSCYNYLFFLYYYSYFYYKVYIVSEIFKILSSCILDLLKDFYIVFNVFVCN